MKKGSTIAIIIAAIMIIVGATLVNIARGRGENVLDYFKGDADLSFSSGVIHIGVDQKDYTVCLSGEESFAAADVKRLDLDWVSGSVKVERWEGRTVVIREDADKPLTEGQRMRWRLRGGTLSVLFCADGEKDVPEKRLTVLLPHDCSLQSLDADSAGASVTIAGLDVAGEIDVDTATGAISVSGCACRALDADAASGSVELAAASVSGGIDVDTASGAVTLRNCVCKELDVETGSGAVTVETSAVDGGVDVDTASGKVTMLKLRAGGDVDVDTVSGAVELRFESLPRSVDVGTTSGAVTLAFPKGTSIDLDFDTLSGSLTGSLHTAPGGLPVDVDTTSGSLTIEED